MFLWWPIDAFGTTCAPDPRGPEHPMLSASVVVVGTVGGLTVVPRGPTGRPSMHVSVRVEEVLRGDPSLRALTVVRLLGTRSVGQEGATVLLHLRPHPPAPGTYELAGRACSEFPPVERRETGLCGAVASSSAGAVLGTYPSDTTELPSAFSVAGDLTVVNGRAVQEQPTADAWCGGLLWDELLVAAREAARGLEGSR